MFNWLGKNWFDRIHMPHVHVGSYSMSHLLHDNRLWVALIVIFLVAAFIRLAVWAILQGDEGYLPCSSLLFDTS